MQAAASSHIKGAAAPELSLAQQATMVHALCDWLRQQSDSAVERFETHISWVLVQGGHAYKLKKALATSFLDQSTLSRRRHACAEELRLNRRLAPELYLGVVNITGTPAAPALDGSGAVIDVAVKMRAFAQAGLWDRLAARGALEATQIDALVAVLVDFHDKAAVASATGALGTPAQVRAPMLETLHELAAAPLDDQDLAGLRQVARWEAAAFAELAPVLTRRLDQGRVREGHGDLHLGNVALVDGRCLVFDGIEFNEGFRWLDVTSELAFMAMDLHAHGLPALAHRLVNGYLQRSGDYDGARVLRYYLVYRALVRAKVALLRAAQLGVGAGAGARAAAQRYLALALRFITAARPVCMITHGFSGSGKTTLTGGLIETCGAIRVRADVQRKRLAGLAELAPSHSAVGAGLYTDAMSQATYANMLEAAAAVLEGGWSVILDATFLQRAQREAAHQLARRFGVPLVVLDCVADTPTLLARLRLRARQGGDASEADAQVLAAQMAWAQALQPDEAEFVFVMPGLDAPAAAWAPLWRWLSPDAPPDARTPPGSLRSAAPPVAPSSALG
jgi:uncharacterized protein